VSFRFGRKRPSLEKRLGHKKMARYMTEEPVPDHDWSTLCAASAISDVLGNDSLGDCTAAGAGHLIDVFTAGGGAPTAVTAAQAIAFYSLSTGYNPADPSTDQGGDEVTVLTTWRDQGFDGHGAHAIAGFVQVDPTNVLELRAACYHFGGLYFGLELPDTYTNPFPSANGFVWGSGTPDPNQGHCVVGFGANSTGILIDSWGLKGTLTYEAITQLCADSAGGMVFAVIEPEWVSKVSGASPSSLNWTQIQADFNLLGPVAAGPSHADLYHAMLRQKAASRRKAMNLHVVVAAFAAGIWAMDYIHDPDSYEFLGKLSEKIPPEMWAKATEALNAILKSAQKPEPKTEQTNEQPVDPDATVRP
jgi:hypothetical protein